MKQRLNQACRAVFALSVGVLLILVFPIWGLIWLITGWDYPMWANRYIDPEWAEWIDKLEQETKEMNESTAKWVADIKKWKKELASNED